MPWPKAARAWRSEDSREFELEVAAGDVILLPPGFGHRQVSMRRDFRICGAYPPGQEDYTVRKSDEGYDEATLARIAAVPFPATDPLWGGDGPLLQALARAAAR